MASSLTLFAKGILIAICAAIAAWAYLFAFTLLHSEQAGLEWAWGEASLGSFLIALLGTSAVGLPIALFTYRFSGKHLARSVTTLAMVAVLAGIMLVLASFVLADEAGVIVLGIPAFISAITFAVLGWFWVLRPMRSGEGTGE